MTGKRANNTDKPAAAPQRRESFATPSGIELRPWYEPAALAKPLGAPGEYPFTRGVQPTMYRSRLWTMRQYAGFGTAQETNKRYRYLLKAGQTGLSVAFDLPTQIGYDPDHELSRGEVGKVGVSIATLPDMAALFKGIPLDSVSTSMTINSTAAVLLALYVAVGRKQGVASGQLRGTVQNDILKEYSTRGTYRFQVRPSLRLTTDIFEFCRDHAPQWNTISISGYHIREAGCTAVQEVAFTLANGIAYVQAAVERGLDVDEFAGRLSFFFNAHNLFFEEVAKFRAARRMWARIMRERFKAKNDNSCKLRFHTQTAGVTLASRQIENNVARVTLQALAAVLGGTQSLHTNGRDEALALPTEESARIALRTQQIIAYESGVADIVDPLGGSPLVESLTDEIEARAAKYIDTIDAMGGAIAAVEKGYIQKEIQRAAFEYQTSIETKGRIVVGINEFVEAEQTKPRLLRVDECLRENRIKELKAHRKRCSQREVAAALKALEAACADSSKNVVPHLVECVEAGVTLGEICEVMAGVFGEYTGAYL